MSRTRWLILGGTALLLAAAVLVGVAFRITPRVHADIERILAARLDSVVTLEDVDVTLFPSPSITGRGLVIRYQGRTDIPPLVNVHAFRGQATWTGAFARRLGDVHVDGLEISIPPKRRADMPELRDPSGSEEAPTFAIDRLVATNARLTIMPREAGKDPRVFDIFALDIRDLTLAAPSRFVASLTNPVPEGTIETDGTFGPWARSEPGDTPIDGRFTFAADLGSIKGIDGALESSGRFAGIVHRIEVSGTTRTPAFAIPRLRASALPLETAFDAVVDGTNGDVQLVNVDARLAGSRFLASGFIVGTKGVKGKRVLLDVTSEEARMEDLLLLTVRTRPPPMTGAVTLATSFDLPQGDRDVVDKLRLAGTVRIARARFTSDAVQEKVDELSRRGRGRPADTSIDGVTSDIAGRFSLDDGVVRLDDLRYRVRGAAISLAGSYALEPGVLDFTGAARLEASLSNTQTGFRHFLLKPFDPLFRKGGAGTRLAIKVTGTVDEPKFGLELRRTLRGR